MKRSAAFIPNINKDFISDKSESVQMLLQGGFVQEIENGVYCVLPLGKRIFSKIEKEVSNQLEKLDAMELSFPILQTKILSELKEKTFKINDSPFSLTFNNFLTMKSLIQDEVNEKPTLPLIFYQTDRAFINDDDTNNLTTLKEFLLNEVYSFHDSEENLHQTYEQVINIYKNLLSKLGLNYRIVKGVPFIKNSLSCEELIILSNVGDETIVHSDQSNYCANIKVAQIKQEDNQNKNEMNPLQKIQLENINDIQDVAEKLNVSLTQCIKSVLYYIDGTLNIVLTRGDHIINETKLKQVLNANEIKQADSDEIKKVLDCSKGYVGPIKLPLDVKVIADYSVKQMVNVIAGSNEEGFYCENVNPDRDFAINLYEDIRFATEGDNAPFDEGKLFMQKGFKVGQFLKLELLNQFNQPIYAGCYYFDISKLFSILAEIFHDSNGFFWPKEMAPFQIYLTVKNVHDYSQRNLADEIYNILSFYRFDVLYDDRDEKTERKFIDSDLIGLPIRVTIGEKAQDGLIDVKIRSTNQTFQFAKEELIDWLTEYFRVE